MKRRFFNPLVLLSLVALLSLFAIPTRNNGLWGFLGFAYYLRYWNVLPDELFYQNLQKACAAAFLGQMIALPFLAVGAFLLEPERMLPLAFGLSFALSIFLFTILLMVLEWREMEGSR